MSDPPASSHEASAYSVRDLVSDPKVLVDTVAPTLLFAVLATRSTVTVAAASALGLCVVVFAYRVARRQGLVHAASGLGGVLVGVVVALVSGDAGGFFLPGIVGNVAFGLVCIVSNLARRPALAYTSAGLYRWPVGWYLHPRVRPAYTEMTWLWSAFYLAKGLYQYHLVREGNLALLTTVRLLSGWPALAGLLAITYAYITWRLRRLGGPDVEEWRAAREPTAQA
ncbi:hypothetical protein BH23ACT9_BH23ACT9_15320 [soil metagenome]